MTETEEGRNEPMGDTESMLGAVDLPVVARSAPAYAAGHGSVPVAAAAPHPLGKDRSPASVLGLTLITFGIYYVVWYGKLNAEIRRHDPDLALFEPLWCVIACLVPIANIVSAYATAARIRQMQLDDGHTTTISPVVALLLFLFLGIGYPLYIASQVREHWHGHRRSLRTPA